MCFQWYKWFLTEKFSIIFFRNFFDFFDFCFIFQPKRSKKRNFFLKILKKSKNPKLFFYHLKQYKRCVLTKSHRHNSFSHICMTFFVFSTQISKIHESESHVSDLSEIIFAFSDSDVVVKSCLVHRQVSPQAVRNVFLHAQQPATQTCVQPWSLRTLKK